MGAVVGDLVQARGAVTSLPPTAASPVSGDLGEVGELDERLLVGAKLNTRFDLLADTALAVPLLAAGGGPFRVGANFILVKCVGKVRVRITTSDGATQAVPVDGCLLLVSSSVYVTAIDFTRVAGVATTVKLFLAEKL